MLWSRRGSWILAAVVALAWAPAALATTVVPVADADLVSTATAIVIADVTAIESRWDPATRRIFTVITLDVRDRLKGEIPLGPLTIRQLGGRVASMQAWVEGSPEFTVGERVLVFLSRNADGTLRVAHLYQGKFSTVTGTARGTPWPDRRCATSTADPRTRAASPSTGSTRSRSVIRSASSILRRTARAPSASAVTSATIRRRAW